MNIKNAQNVIDNLFRDQWDMMMKEVGDVQKKQDAQQQHWSNYKDSLAYIMGWLDNMEAGLNQDQVK